MVTLKPSKIRRLSAKLVTAWHEHGLHGIRLLVDRCIKMLPEVWASFWMQYAGRTVFGRLATWMATRAPVPYAVYYHRGDFSELNPRGFIAPSAKIHHSDIRLGRHVFIGENVLIMEDIGGGPVVLGERVRLRSETTLHTGDAGCIKIGEHTWVGPRCQFAAYIANVTIGSRVFIGPSCSFFPYDHGMDPSTPIGNQPMKTKGDIVIEDDVWLGTGVVVLSGVHIGRSAVIGAGAVVTRDVPSGARAVGVPARVIRQHDDTPAEPESETVLIRAADGTIWACNNTSEQLYGWRAQETIGHKSHTLLQTVFPMPLDRIEAELRDRGYWQGQLIHTRRDGSQVLVNSRWEVLGTAGTEGPTVLEINKNPVPYRSSVRS